MSSLIKCRLQFDDLHNKEVFVFKEPFPLFFNLGKAFSGLFTCLEFKLSQICQFDFMKFFNTAILTSHHASLSLSMIYFLRRQLSCVEQHCSTLHTKGLFGLKLQCLAVADANAVPASRLAAFGVK